MTDLNKTDESSDIDYNKSNRREYKPWSDINIGAQTYFKGCSLVGVDFGLKLQENRLTVHHVGEHTFEVSSKKFPTNKTCESVEAFAIRKGLEVINEHRRQYIKEAKALGIDLSDLDKTP